MGNSTRSMAIFQFAFCIFTRGYRLIAWYSHESRDFLGLSWFFIIWRFGSGPFSHPNVMAIWGSWSICWPWHHVRQRAAGFDAASAGKKEGDLQKSMGFVWNICWNCLFFVSLKVGRCCWKSIISMNFHISTIQIGHGVGDLKWFATLIPWWWFQLDRATMVEFSDRNMEDFATGAPIFLCLWGTPSSHVISDNLWDFATNWYRHPQSKPLG